VVRLGEVARIDRRSVQPEDIADGQVYLGLEHIETGGYIAKANAVNAGDLKSSKFAFDTRHVLFGKLRPNLAKVARPPFEGVCSTDIVPILPGPNLDRDYLANFLLTPQIVNWASSRTSGVNLPRLSPGVLEGLEIPLPPLPEQRRIASTLDDLDQLRRQRRGAIAATSELLTSAFIDEFGDPLRTASHRSAVTLESLCTAVVDCPHTTPSWTESGVLCLRTTNLARGEWRFDETRYVSAETHESRVKRARLEPGDIILSREGTVGIGAIVPPSMIASMGQRLVQLRPDQSRVLPEFLLSYLLEVLEPTRLSRLLVGSTALHVNVRDIRTLRVDVPPMERQLAFGKAVGVVRAKLELQRAHLAKLDELFASLQHRAFRGEL